MGVHRQRRVLVLTLTLAACASAPDGRAASQPVDYRPSVVVVASSGVSTPLPPSAAAQAVGTDSAQSVVAKEAAQVLVRRGYRVQDVSSAPSTGGSAADTLRLAWSRASLAGAEAALVVHLTAMDLSSVDTLGQASISLDAQLVRMDGSRLWSAVRTVSTKVDTYRAKNDWRAHVREAVQRSMRGMP